jgi:hypothetical protein
LLLESLLEVVGQGHQVNFGLFAWDGVGVSGGVAEEMV